MVSGRYFLPALPALWVNWMPAAAVTSVKRTVPPAVVRAAQPPSRGMSRCADAATSCKPDGIASRQARCQEQASSSMSYALVIVNRLPLVVVLGAQQARLGRDRLRRFVGLEAAEQLLFARGLLAVAQAAIAEHQRVVRLHVFGIDAAAPAAAPPPPRAYSRFRKQDAADLVAAPRDRADTCAATVRSDASAPS